MPPTAFPAPSLPPPSLGERLRVRWLVLTQGHDKAWREAVETRNLPLALFLHKMGVSAKGLDASAVIRAVEMSGTSMLQLVLSSNANPNQQEREGMLTTPLHAAALSGDQGKVRMLVRAGANVNIRGNLGVTPLASVLKALPSEAPALPSPEAKRAMVFCLLDLGAGAKEWTFRKRESMLRMAPLDLEILDGLVSAGANPRRLINPTPARGCKPLEGEQELLFRAVEIHDLKKMDDFLGHLGKSPYRQGAHTRGRHGRGLLFEMVRAWLPPPSASAKDPRKSWDRLIDLLVSHGHSLTSTDDMGNTVLHAWAQALAPSFYPCGQALLARPEVAGLIEVKNGEGKCPLDLLLESQGVLDKVPGGWEMLAYATQDKMEGALEPAPPVPVRAFHSGGRL